MIISRFRRIVSHKTSKYLLFAFFCGVFLFVYFVVVVVVMNCLAALGLVVIQSIIFIVASMGLCFGFVTKTALITQGCFSYCWAVLSQCQSLFCCSHHPASEKMWSWRIRDWEGAQLGQLTPADQRNSPYCMTLCWAISAGWGQVWPVLPLLGDWLGLW